MMLSSWQYLKVVLWLSDVLRIPLESNICYRSCTVDSRTENLMPIGHSVAEIFDVKVVHDQ